MTTSVNSKTYTADSFQKDSVSYIGAAKTASVKDDILMSRQAPKPTVSFSGMGRARLRLVRTLTLTGALTPTGDATVDISFSIPVGFTGADVDAMLDDLAAYLDDANAKALVKNQKISF